MQQFENKKLTIPVKIGSVVIGGGNPIVVQSMTDTPTSDVEATVNQIIELYEAGSEIVRITVNNLEAAKAVVQIRNKLLAKNYQIPLVGCFHYNGHQLLTEVSECASALDKYRINPGNVGFGDKKEKQFEIMVQCAISYNKPIRIGVNWGSLDKDLTAKLMDENARLTNPLPINEIMREAIISSALLSAEKAEELGLSANRIVISAKVSKVQDLIAVYQGLAKRCNYSLHLGLTEAGMGIKGVVSTTSALAILLHQGIGDTIRASITPKPNESRHQEVRLCQEILQNLDLRSFNPAITSCPGCGRTSSDYFRTLANDIQHFIDQVIGEWRTIYPGVEKLKIAVMGCIVNGPGESKHADIGISLPGSGEQPIAPVFVDGEKRYTLRGDNIAKQFKDIVNDYVRKRFHNTHNT